MQTHQISIYLYNTLRCIRYFLSSWSLTCCSLQAPHASPQLIVGRFSCQILSPVWRMSWSRNNPLHICIILFTLKSSLMPVWLRNSSEKPYFCIEFCQLFPQMWDAPLLLLLVLFQIGKMSSWLQREFSGLHIFALKMKTDICSVCALINVLIPSLYTTCTCPLHALFSNP